jgi:hypothetical protein
MAQRLAPLLATQLDRVQSLVLSGPMISVEKVSLFCNPESGTRSQALAKMFPHLKARVHVGRGIPHSKDSLSLLMDLKPVNGP